MKHVFLLLFVTFFHSCLIKPSPKILHFESAPVDRLIIFSAQDPSAMVDLNITQYPTKLVFNDCLAHLDPSSAQNKMTQKSLGYCESNASLEKIDGELFFNGNIHLYKGTSHFWLGNENAQVFDKISVGKTTDFERFVRGLKLKGSRIKEGYNKFYFETDTVFIYLLKNKPYEIIYD
ncbi:MAG: hypothetical protein ACTTIC_04125 [Helicobacteraceae bacterium]